MSDITALRITDKFELSETPFKFVITTYAPDTTLNITASHYSGCKWTKSFANVGGSMTESGTMPPTESLSPKFLFTLFKQYQLGKLSPVYKFFFPAAYESVDKSLVIELHTQLPYHETAQVNKIYLEHVSMTDLERFNLSMAHFTERTIEPLQLENKAIKERLARLDDVVTTTELRQVMEKVKVELLQIIGAHVDVLNKKIDTELSEWKQNAASHIGEPQASQHKVF